MTDLNHTIGAELSVSATGDIQQVDGLSETTQRILRRLLTNPGDYIYHPEYGAGLGRKVGTLLDVPAITGLIRSQMFLEADVARSPAPVISVRALPDGISCRIQYQDGSTGQLATLAFDVNR